MTDPVDASHTHAARSASPLPVAVVIPAKDESARIAETVASAWQIPGVTLVVVVDDGSTDATADRASKAGARVVSHSRNFGKATAMATGAQEVMRIETYSSRNRGTHILMFLDADLGQTARAAAPLIDPVAAGDADFTIAVLPPQQGAAGHGRVLHAARHAIERTTGFHALAPLSGQRCMTRAAFEAALPFAGGWGVEVGMTIDLLVKGFTVQEVLCDLTHRPSGRDMAGQVHRARQLRDVLRAVAVRRARHVTVHARNRSGMPSLPYQPYKATRSHAQ
ncbi:MAG: glycosyltransferase family 2 protein [Actinomycetaceae bacterium]|nr:glycosyltransferase family 2 protein [Actinomycetaceae bacterium]MDY6082344.1 glycosyltransferase family 2 protein [Actinomycetaceae bacterium]